MGNYIERYADAEGNSHIETLYYGSDIEVTKGQKIYFKTVTEEDCFDGMYYPWSFSVSFHETSLTTKPYSEGTIVSDSFDYYNKTRYEFTPAQTMRYAIEVTGDSYGDIFIYDEAGNELSNSYFYNNETRKFNYPFNADDVYYISFCSDSKNYTLNATFKIYPITEQTESVNVDELVQVNDTDSNITWLEFTVPNTGFYMMNVEATDSGVTAPALALYKNKWRYYDFKFKDSDILLLEAGKTYYITNSSLSLPYSCNYNLTISEVQYTVEDIATDDAKSCTNSESGVTVYRFTAETDGIYTITSNANGYHVFELYTDAVGAGYIDSESGWNNAEIKHKLSAGEQVYIRIKGSDGYLGSFGLNITKEEAIHDSIDNPSAISIEDIPSPYSIEGDFAGFDTTSISFTSGTNTAWYKFEYMEDGMMYPHYDSYDFTAECENNINIAVYNCPSWNSSIADYQASSEGSGYVTLSDVTCDSDTASYIKVESIDGSVLGDITLTIKGNW